MPTQVKKTRRNRYAAPIGGLFIALAALGVVTVAVLCIRLTTVVLDNSRERLMFENIIRPVVMFDPAPFENPVDIEMRNLLQYSMWSTLMGEKRNTYQFGENSELMVPASDLDVAAAKLFGPDVKLEHQSFGEFDMFYYYDEPTATYNVPMSAQLYVYTPSVEEITKNGELFELNVGYLPSGISWQTDYSGGKGVPEPEKYMTYVMQRSKTGYYIVKVQYPVDTPSYVQRQQQQQMIDPANSAEATETGGTAEQ